MFSKPEKIWDDSFRAFPIVYLNDNLITLLCPTHDQYKKISWKQNPNGICEEKPFEDVDTLSAIHANYSPNFILTIKWLHLLMFALKMRNTNVHILPISKSVILHDDFMLIKTFQMVLST